MQNIANQLVYFGFLQSLFLLFIFMLSAKVRKKVNGYIVFLTFLLTVGLIGRIIHITGLSDSEFRFISLSEFATLFFGSTIYLFTRSSLLGEKPGTKDWLHFIPGVVYSLAVTVCFLLPREWAISMRPTRETLFTMITTFITFGLTVNIAYYLASVRLFFNFQKQLKHEVSYSVKFRFFQNFLIALGLCFLCWIVVFFISLFGDQMTERTAREFIWLGIAFIILFIAYYGIREPDLYQVASLLPSKKYAQSKLSIKDLDLLKSRLDQLMEEKKPYLNRKLLKAELAEMLGISNPEMARLLNEKVGMNFFEYVNYYRIKEFIELAKTDKAKTLTFFGLAQEAGFNSKTTFNKSFKNLMGTSPKEYLDKEV